MSKTTDYVIDYHNKWTVKKTVAYNINMANRSKLQFMDVDGKFISYPRIDRTANPRTDLVMNHMETDLKYLVSQLESKDKTIEHLKELLKIYGCKA